MTFEPYDYVVVSYDLCDHKPLRGEANSRGAYSRSYYAAFLIARERIRPYVSAEHLEGGEAHRYVHLCLKNSSDLQVRGFATQLREFGRKRRNSDYVLATSPEQSVALAKINASNAKVWIEEFRKISEEQLQKAIRSPW